jgi:hypothetical protein
MSRLNDLYDEVDGVQSERTVYNNFPGGTYQVRLFRATLKESKAGNEYIEVTGDIEGGDYEGELMNAMFHFPEDNPDIAKFNMNRFKGLNNLIKFEYKADMLADAVVQDSYSGIVVECEHVVKPNTKAGKDPFHNWYFNKLIKGKEGFAPAERGAPPSKPPKSKSKDFDCSAEDDGIYDDVPYDDF